MRHYTSSIVHADCQSLSYEFLDFLSAGDDQRPVLLGCPSWAPIIASSCSWFDILQLFETLYWLGIDAAEEWRTMSTKWTALRRNLFSAEP